MVSVLSITFNQKDYIRQAIDSFLAQQVDFPIEIMVNDDCSTDGTTDIVLGYQKEHPELFRITTHDENQYSLGKSPMGEFQVPLARGKYIAMCEGDDYWTDPTKLQKQFDYMEAHPEVAACVHATDNVHAETGVTMKTQRYADHDCMISVEDAATHSQCYATNSLFIRTDVLKDYRRSPFFKLKVDGDHRMLIYFTMVAGGIHYHNEVMSAYRMFAKGSVNLSMAMSDKIAQVAKEKHDNRIELLKFADEYTHGRYHQEITDGIESMDYGYYRDIRDIRTLRRRWPERLRHEGFLAHLDMDLYTYCRPLHKLAIEFYTGFGR